MYLLHLVQGWMLSSPQCVSMCLLFWHVDGTTPVSWPQESPIHVVQSEPNGWDAAGCMTDIIAMRVSGVSRVCRQLEHVGMRWAWDVGQFVRNLWNFQLRAAEYIYIFAKVFFNTIYIYTLHWIYIYIFRRTSNRSKYVFATSLAFFESWLVCSCSLNCFCWRTSAL